MRREGQSLIEIMIVVAIVAMLVAIAIPSLIRARCTANESIARAHLKTICSACEAYASANGGLYPTSELNLTSATPSYLFQQFDHQTVSGYKYSYTFIGIGQGYSIFATPETPNFSGVNSYIENTGCQLLTLEPV